MSLHTDHSPIHPQDHTIDQVLTALRDTPAPAGLEARIAHRLLQAQADAAHPATNVVFPAGRQTATRFFAAKFFAAQEFFAVILEPNRGPQRAFFALWGGMAKDPRILLATATALAVALAIPLTHLHHNQPNIASNTTTPTATHPTTNTVILSEVSRGPMRETQSKDLPAARITTASHALPTPTPTTVQDDPEAIALAETLAPSQPIPQQPLTPQERLLLRATRQGQPLEVAELELAREPFLRAAAVARERFTFAQVARSLLAPLAEAESLEPKPSAAEAPPAASTELQPPSPR
jgi:hypothetical protein